MQPENQKVSVGATATFSVKTTDAKGYLWQYRRSETGSWNNTTMEGYNTATLKVEATAARDGYQYRCTVTGSDGTKLTSNAATLQVIYFTVQPENRRGIAGGTVNFKVTASYTDKIKYQWQYTKNGTTWSNTSMTGCNTDTLTVDVTAGRDGYLYRCIITDAHGNTTCSATAKLIVIQITQQPASQSVATGDTAKFQVTLSDTKSVTYCWQYRRSTTGNWSNTTMTGYNTNTLSVGATASRDGYQYRCIITLENGDLLTTDTATLILK